MGETDTLTTEEAAAELGVTPSRVRQMIRAGELPARRFGKVHVINRRALKAAVQRKTKPGPAPKSETEKMERAARKKAIARWEGEGGSVLPRPKAGIADGKGNSGPSKKGIKS